MNVFVCLIIFRVNINESYLEGVFTPLSLAKLSMDVAAVISHLDESIRSGSHRIKDYTILLF